VPLSGLVGVDGELGDLAVGDRVGVLVGAIYQKRRTRRDGLEIFGYRSFPVGGGDALVPTLIGSTLFEQDRERYGANIGIQFRPSDALEINITGLYSRFNADNFNQNYIAWGEQALGGGGTISKAVVRDGVAVSGDIASANGGTSGSVGRISRQSPKYSVALPMISLRFHASIAILHSPEWCS